jgi:hypothetical protein
MHQTSYNRFNLRMPEGKSDAKSRVVIGDFFGAGRGGSVFCDALITRKLLILRIATRVKRGRNAYPGHKLGTRLKLMCSRLIVEGFGLASRTDRWSFERLTGMNGTAISPVFTIR